MRQAWSVRQRAPAGRLESLRVQSPLLAQLLINRGIESAEAAQDFLSPLGQVHDPTMLAGVPEATARIGLAVDRRERIVVYGDYDADGISGAALLHRALKAVGADVKVFIPDRERDGYGLNREQVVGLANNGANLLISVDCGITAVDAVSDARAHGLDVIITDHHAVSSELPDAVAIVNPHQPECRYPFKGLSGAGVALKVATAALDALGYVASEDELDDLFSLALIGTVADVVTLRGENRAIVRRGLARLNSSPTTGLAALIAASTRSNTPTTARSVAFSLAPRLNAAGRIARADLAFRLLTSDDRAEAAALADELESLNTRRRALTAEAIEQARISLVEQGRKDLPAVAVAGDFGLGLIGLVAARLADELARPVAVISTGPRPARGSVRSVPGVSAVELLNQASSALLSYGGHAGAAGFSVDHGAVDDFAERFADAGLAFRPSEAVPIGPVADCRLYPRSVSLGLCDTLERLEPFGEGNPVPLFQSDALAVGDVRPVGTDGRHLRMVLEGADGTLRCVMFNAGSRAPARGEAIDVLYQVRRNEWNGQSSVDVVVEDWRPAVRG